MITNRSIALHLAIASSLAGFVAVADAQTSSSMAASGAMSSGMAASGMSTKHKMMKPVKPATHEASDMNTARSTAVPASAPMGQGTMPSTMSASSPRK